MYGVGVEWLTWNNAWIIECGFLTKISQLIWGLLLPYMYNSIFGHLQFTVQVFLIFCVFQLEKVHGGARPRPRPIFVQPQESSKIEIN